jgi:hypothetical protein
MAPVESRLLCSRERVILGFARRSLVSCFVPFRAAIAAVAAEPPISRIEKEPAPSHANEINVLYRLPNDFRYQAFVSRTFWCSKNERFATGKSMFSDLSKSKLV